MREEREGVWLFFAAARRRQCPASCPSMRRLVKGIRRADSTFPVGSDVLLLFALVLDNVLSGAW